MVLRYDPPVRGRWTSHESYGILNLRTAIVEERVGQWPDVTERPLEIIRPKDRCGFDDPASRHCWSPYGCAALDSYLDAFDPAEREQGWRLALRAVAGADRLGVQGVNYNGWIWGYGTWGWRRIGPGSHQHHDHVHIEINDRAARGLTEGTARQVLRPLPAPQEEELLVTTLAFAAQTPSQAGRIPTSRPVPALGVLLLENGAHLPGDIDSDGTPGGDRVWPSPAERSRLGLPGDAKLIDQARVDGGTIVVLFGFTNGDTGTYTVNVPKDN